MTSFTFSEEQVRSAPPEVRRWMENEIRAVFHPTEPAAAPEPAAEPSLAACTEEEAAGILSLLGGQSAAAGIFLEFGRETAKPAENGLYRLSVNDIVHRHPPADGDQLVKSFYAINAAFQKLRQDPQATLFGFDHAGQVYIHEGSHRSIALLWAQLVSSRFAAQEAPAGHVATQPGFTSAFAAPHLGPSEDIAAHAPTQAPAAVFSGWPKFTPRPGGF